MPHEKNTDHIVFSYIRAYSLTKSPSSAEDFLAGVLVTLLSHLPLPKTFSLAY